MHLLGSLAFLVAGVLLSAAVVLRKMTDAGEASHRALKSQEVEIWEELADFEKRGGRVNVIEPMPSTQLFRARSLDWRASALAAVALLVPAICFLLAWWWWIPMLLVFLFVVRNDIAGEVRLHLTKKGSSDWRYERHLKQLLSGVALKALLLVIALCLVWVAALCLEDGAILWAIPPVVLGALLIDRCHIPARWIEGRIRRLQQIGFAGETSENAILFLRSFDDDALRLYAPGSSVGWIAPLIPQRGRLEELLEGAAYIFTDHVVAIGRPGERRPTLGAERTYWTDETWRDAVRHTAARCKAIVLVAGSTEGLGWEISTLAEMRVLGKTLVILPHVPVEDGRLRYQRIASHLKRPQDALLDNVELLESVPALTFTPEGDLVHYASAGRNWASYAAVLNHFIGTLETGKLFQEQGFLSSTDDPVQLAYHAALNMDQADLAQEILDEALGEEAIHPDERERIDIALAAIALLNGAGVDEAIAILNRGSESPLPAPDDMIDGVVTLRQQASAQLQESSPVSPSDLFALVLPPYMFDPGRELQLEKMSRRAESKLLRLEQAVDVSGLEGDHEAAHRFALAGAEYARGQGLELASAMFDVLVAEQLMLLGRDHEANQLAREVLRRELPDQYAAPKIFSVMSSVDVKDRATGVLIDLFRADPEHKNKHGAEHRRLLEEKYERRASAGKRADAARAALELSVLELELENADDARRWAETALTGFTELGMLKAEAETLVVLGHSAIENKEFDKAWKCAQEALDLIETQDLDELRGDAAYLSATAAEQWASLLRTREAAERAVNSIRRSLEIDQHDGTVNDRDIRLTEALVSHLMILDESRMACDTQAQAVVMNERRRGVDHLWTLHQRLRLLRLIRDRDDPEGSEAELNRLVHDLGEEAVAPRLLRLHEAQVESLGELSEETINTLGWLSHVHRILGNPEQASEYRQLAVDRAIEAWGPDDHRATALRNGLDDAAQNT